MPNSSDKIGAELNDFAEQVNQMVEKFHTYHTPVERVQKIQQNLRNLRDIVNQSVNNPEALEPEAYERFRVTLKQYGDDMTSYVTDYGKSYNEYDFNEDFYRNIVDFAGYLRANDDKLVAIRDMLKFTSEFKALYADKAKKTETLQKNVTTQFQKIGVHGQRPTLSECYSLSVEKNKPETVFSRMLWLHDQQFTASLANPDRDNSTTGFYQETLNRLREELENASPATQARYAAMFLYHDIALKGRANGTLKKYHDDAPGEQTPQQKEDYAKQKLSTDSNYLNARSFTAFCDSFRNSRMNKIMAHLAMGRNGTALLNSDKLQSMTDMVSGGLNHYLEEKNLAGQVNQTNQTAMKQKAKESDTRASSTVSQIGSLFKTLMEDKGKASETFTSMRDALLLVATMDHTSAATRDAYMAALEKAKDMAQDYLNTHKGLRFTESGKKRVEMAMQMKALMEQQYKKQNELRIAEDQQKAVAVVNRLRWENNPDALRQAAKINRHITPVRIVPREHKFTGEVTEMDELKGKIKHDLFSATHKIMGGVNSLVCHVMTKDKPLPDSRPTTELETDRIPGRNGEKFQKFDPDDPRNGGADQKILSDVRRPPMVWETVIPEDPNQPPTITFEFDQGREGDPIAYPLVEENGSQSNEMGHGFVTLQYTKNNPFSGKPERYKVSFGFYPKGGFTGNTIMSTQIMKGIKIPGQLNEDNTHEFSTGLTYTVNNQQINKVLLAAQEYEKGGYNFFDRNCTTFVKDMSEVAGIDLSGVLKQVDLTSEGKTAEFAMLNAGGAKLMSFLAMNDILKKVGREDQSYQRFNQKMLNKEDMVRIEEGMKIHNKRMKGYTPGHATESARIAKNFKLHSSKYNLRIKNAKGDNKRVNADKRGVFAMRTKLRLEFGNLCSAIIRRAEEDGITPDKLEGTVDQLSEFTDKMIKAVDIYAHKGFLGVDPMWDMAKCTWTEQRHAMVEGTAALNEMIDGYDEIFRNTFKSDPALNIPFQHMVAIITRCKNAFAEKYRDLAEYLFFDSAGFETNNAKVRAAHSVDVTRDSFQSLRAFCMSRVNIDVNGTRFENRNIADIAAMIQAFGSCAEGFKALNRRTELQEKPDKTPDEEKELDTLDRKHRVFKSFVHAQNSYFEDRPFTVGDYSYAFIDLEQGMAGAKTDPVGHSPAEIYQNVALEKIFGGTKQILEPILKDAADALRDLQQDEDFQDLDEEKQKVQKNRTLGKKLREAKIAVSRHLSDMMVEKHDDFVKLTSVCLERAKLNTPSGPNKSRQEYNTEIANKAEKFMVDKLVDSYLKPVTEDILKELGNRLPPKLDYKVLFTPETITLNPEFCQMQRRVDRELGITRPDAIEEKQKPDELAKGQKQNFNKPHKNEGEINNSLR